MSPLVKNVVMFAVLAVAVILAAVFFMRGDPESGLSTAKSSTTHWVCVKCGKDHPLTAAELDEWQHNPQKHKKDTVAKMFHFYCSDCKDFNVVRGMWCETEGLWLPRVDLQGNLQDCPSDKAAQNEG